MAQRYGGYESASPSDGADLEKLTCNTICTKVLRDPHQTKCCGQVFCESCLNHWFTTHGKKSCPHCQTEGENFQHFLDKRLKREIDSLKIYCTNKEEGCQWVGEVERLKDHLESDNGCGYVEVECPNKCNETIKRKELDHHLRNTCQLRTHQCEHCKREDTYDAIVSHIGSCPDRRLECTNGCGRIIKRKNMKTHFKKCPEQLTKCSNNCKHEGETVTVKRKDLPHHLSDECGLRPYQCEYCGLTVTYDAIDAHSCPEVQLECPNKCGAKGIKRKDMEDHRSQCPDEMVNCSNKCAVEKNVKRKELAKHLKEKCELRPYQCEHCGLKDNYKAVVIHFTKCNEIPLDCPNECGAKDIKRKDMEDHHSQCPEEPVQCPFEEAGCKEKLVRRKMEQHMSTNQQQHLLMVMGAYKEVMGAYKEVKQELTETKQKLNDLSAKVIPSRYGEAYFCS